MQILGKGIYRFSEAARLTGLSPRRVRAWFEGWSERGTPVARGRVFRRDYPDQEAISFLDLIEVCVAGHLREQGISLIAIRRAHRSLADQLKTDHPFAHRELYTDGKTLFVRIAEDNRSDLVEIIERQHVIPQVLLPHLQRVSYDPSSLLARQWDIAEGIVLDPRRHFGKPILKNSAMPTSVLALAYYGNRRDADAVADWYGVARADVELAVSFESRYLGKAA